jgi:hypothetical protein
LPATKFDLSIKAKPRLEGGVSLSTMSPFSERMAAAVAPEEAAGAAAIARYHHDLAGALDHHGTLDHDARPLNHDHLAVGTADTLSVAVESGAASIGCVRGTKARDRAGNDNCCEKVFHVLSLREPRRGPLM